MSPFNSIYRHGFVRLAVCIPFVRLGNPSHNAARTIELARRAHDAQAAVVLFPELGLSGYSNEDLFHQDALLVATSSALAQVVDASRTLRPLLVVGAPLRFEQKLFNCAVAIHQGRVLGVTPKTYLPTYREFYERRQFTPGTHACLREVPLLGGTVPFGNDVLFEFTTLPDCAVHMEVCEDLWVPVPPSSRAALAGATILTNLSASNVTIGKSEYRRLLCASQSGRCLAAYAYAAAGSGESTTDLAWDGHGMVYENGQLLAETERFATTEQLVVADVDLERLVQERVRMTSFNDAVVEQQRGPASSLRRVPVPFEIPEASFPLVRNVDRFPYVPSDPAARDERCREAFNIQVQGLASRLASSGITKAVVGVSGGLDSAQALIVTARALDRLGLPRTNVLGFSMPGFATTERTRTNALALMRALGVTVNEIDIRPSCLLMLKDLGHPYASGQNVYDVTFENVQAGERTSHLFRLANQYGGLVVGTSDLSELALGWCTYGVGDQMSHYAVNASVPKTLIRYLIRWVIRSRQFDETTSDVLQSIADTPFSPELVPGAGRDAASPPTESIVGPFELQDFFLYCVSRFGYRPSRVVFLAEHAWGNRARGVWPDDVNETDRHEYDRATIKRWLAVFLRRFFETSQFKRSAIPNAPKVGSGGSLSPRSDWRAPSDGHADAWLEELERETPD